MRRIDRIVRKGWIAALGLLILLQCSMFVRAEGEEISEDGFLLYENPDTGYTAILLDGADVLETENERSVMDSAIEVTQYGNAFFYSDICSGYADDRRSRHMAVKAYTSFFSEYSDGVIVAIILDDDKQGGCTLWIEAFNKMHSSPITSSYASTIADNAISVTRKAASGSNYYGYDGTRNYYGYANEAFVQILKLLNGEKIAKPMKYVTSALLALILALLINFIIVSAFNKKKKATDQEVLSGLRSQFLLTDTKMVLTHTDRKYSPRSSGSSGGGGGGGGGGSHGGGGHRG